MLTKLPKRNPLSSCLIYFYFFLSTLWHLLRDTMLFWRSQGPNVLSFWGNSCNTMWWANTFLVHRGSFNQAYSSEYLLCGFFFSYFCRLLLETLVAGSLIVYFVLPFFAETFTWQSCWYERQSRPEIPQEDCQLPRRWISCTANYSWVCETAASNNALFVPWMI